MFNLLHILRQIYYNATHDHSIEARESYNLYSEFDIEASLSNIFFLGIAIVLPIAIYINLLTSIEQDSFNFIIFSIFTISLLITLENLISLYISIKNNNEITNLNSIVIRVFERHILAFSIILVAPFISLECSYIDLIFYLILVGISYLSIYLSPQNIMNITIAQVTAVIFSVTLVLFMFELLFSIKINSLIYAYSITHYFYFFTILVYIQILLLLKRIPDAINTASFNITINNDEIIVNDINYDDNLRSNF